jgi:hypothetical protein
LIRKKKKMSDNNNNNKTSTKKLSKEKWIQYILNVDKCESSEVSKSLVEDFKYIQTLVGGSIESFPSFLGNPNIRIYVNDSGFIKEMFQNVNAAYFVRYVSQDKQDDYNLIHGPIVCFFKDIKKNSEYIKRADEFFEECRKNPKYEMDYDAFLEKMEEKN